MQKRRSPFCLTYTRTREAGDESSYPTPKPNKIKPNSKAAHPEVFFVEGWPKKKSGQHRVLVLASQTDLPKIQNLHLEAFQQGIFSMKRIGKMAFQLGSLPKVHVALTSIVCQQVQAPFFVKDTKGNSINKPSMLRWRKEKRQSNRYI